jgi:hypothetical protein
MRYTPLLLAALFLGACATLPSPAAGPDRSGPLEAWIVPHQMGGIDGSSINFWVSRPAHVAIYQIAPMGGGAMLIYPRHSGGSSLHYAGFNSGFLGSQRAQRASAQFAFRPMAGSLGGFGPTYYLLVASERPLNVDRYAVSPMALQSDIPRLASMTVGQLASELTQLSLGPATPPHGEWTTDLYVHWPMLPAPRTLLAMDTGVRMVQCPGGTVIDGGGRRSGDLPRPPEPRRRGRRGGGRAGRGHPPLRGRASRPRRRSRRRGRHRRPPGHGRRAAGADPPHGGGTGAGQRDAGDAGGGGSARAEPRPAGGQRTRATRQRPTREASPATTRTRPTSSGEARPASPPATRPTPASFQLDPRASGGSARGPTPAIATALTTEGRTPLPESPPGLRAGRRFLSP